jgi:SET domain-containing protein
VIVRSYRAECVERREGGVHGVGLFATRDIVAEEVLALKNGHLVTEDVIKEYSEIINGSHVQVTDNLFLAGLTLDEVDATLIGYNHSCSPNAYIRGQIALTAMRPINSGEEITVEYATCFSSDTQSFNCRCGSDNCRKFIRPSVDSNDPELRKKFAGYFADFLKEE